MKGFPAVSVRALSDADFADLLAFRTAMRRFNRWSERQAKSVGLTHAQHQLLLAVRGHADPRGPTIGDVGEYLLLRHHSAVELVNRAEAAGMVVRERDADDGRVVRLRLTAAGERAIDALTSLHLQELKHLAAMLERMTDDLD